MEINKLPMNRLGQTDMKVSLVGLGTVKFGRQQGVKYPHAFALPTDIEILHLLNCASELGINLLDTAPAYGTSEERLGALLKGQRDRWVIATKAGEEFYGANSHYDYSAQAIRASVERSLQRLQTDYLDVVLIHSNGDDLRIINEDQVFLTLAALKQAGKIRAYGMSTKTMAGGLLTIEEADVAMVAYHANYIEEVSVIERAHELQKGIFIKKALESGHAQQPANAMRFACAPQGVTSVIVGTLNSSHLRSNIAALASPALSRR